METKELQQLLLSHYRKAVSLVEKAQDVEAAHKVVVDMNVHNGICNCAHECFGEDIYLSGWVAKYSKHGIWGIFPSVADTKEEIIQMLLIRVQNLSNELNQPQ